MMRRREFLASGLACVAVPGAAHAQEKYPARPVRLVIPSVPAGVHDVIGRLWAERAKLILGAIVIDNRGGGGGMIGANDVANAQPDGYSILLGSTTTQVLAPLGTANPLYDPVKSFSAVAAFAFSSTSIVVNPRVPVQSLRELIAHAKANPGKLSYGSGGVATTTNMAGELFKKLAGGLDIVHVPYKGIGQGVGDLISGQIPIMSANVTGQILQLQQTGKVRIVSVNAAARLKGAPDIPTSIESGLPGMVAQTTFGIFAPAGTPKPIIARLAEVTQQVMADAAFQRELVRQGFEPMLGVSGDQANKVFADELARWTPILKAGLSKR